MKRFKIQPLNLEEDIPQISLWEQKYKNHPGYKAIEHFILEDNTYYTLAEVLKINYEQYPIGEDERKHALSVKSKDDELIGFVLATVIDKTTPSPSMFLQYIVLSPKFQNQGYGREILTELFENTEKYFECKVNEVFAYIHDENYHSMKLFLEKGANLVRMDKSCYYQATTKLSQLEKDRE